MNAFIYGDNTFLSPPIDLPSKLIKRANLALFTAPSPNAMSESTSLFAFENSNEDDNNLLSRRAGSPCRSDFTHRSQKDVMA